MAAAMSLATRRLRNHTVLHLELRGVRRAPGPTCLKNDGVSESAMGMT